jgi:hypothetical protein
VASLGLQATMDRASGISALAHQTMARAERSSNDARIGVVVAAAWDAAFAGDLARTRALCDPLRPNMLGASDLALSMSTIGALSLVDMYSGEFDRSRAVLEELARVVDDFGGAPAFVPPFLTSTLAMVDLLEGSMSVARERAERAVALAREARNPTSLALALYTLGWATMQSDPERALGLFDEAIALVRAGATDMVLVHCLARAAALRAERDDPEAIANLTEALTYATEIGSQITMMTVLDYSVDVLAFLGYSEPAAVAAGSVGDGARFVLNPVEGPEEQRRARSRARAHAALGDDAYARAFERGRAMSEDEVRTFLSETLAVLQHPEVARD